jgi:hypothetical protein
MKSLIFAIGFGLGLFAAVGCDEAQEDEGVLFACGDDMCLSSEEFCGTSDPCAYEGTEPPPIVASCGSLDDLEFQVACSGDEKTGITCSNACG